MIVSLLAATTMARPLLNGADLSFLPEYRDLGAKFLDGDASTDPLDSFVRRGAKLLRLRVWVHPPKGYCSVQRTLALAKEAKAKGMKLLIDFHYSDDWADPQHQVTPEAWRSFDQASLSQAVYSHTKATMQRLVAQGTAPEMVQVGNEIRNGMLWPIGDTRETGYGPLCRLLRAGVRAVREVSPRSQVMIHHDRGADLGVTRDFFGELKKRGVKFDVIGLSYYPWWHGTLPNLEKTLNGLAAKFNRPVMVVETAYPFSLGWKDQTGNFVGEEKQLAPGFPATPDGQASFLKELNRIVRAVPEGRGLGVVYWAPEYIAWPGMQSPYENLCLYDFEGRVLPGLNELGATQ